LVGVLLSGSRRKGLNPTLEKTGAKMGIWPAEILVSYHHFTAGWKVI
jgi:hypothetical protein